MRSLELHRLSGMDESSGDRIACDFSGGARLRRHGGGGRNVVEELESPPWSVGSTAEPTYWSGGGAAEPLLGGLTCALGGQWCEPIRGSRKPLAEASQRSWTTRIGRTLSRRSTRPPSAAPERDGFLESHRSEDPSISHVYGLWLSGPRQSDAMIEAPVGSGNRGLTQDSAGV